MLIENLIAHRLILVKITISRNLTFDGKSNITISHHWQNLKCLLGKIKDQRLKRYLRTFPIVVYTYTYMIVKSTVKIPSALKA